MANILENRVKETSATTGTGALTVAGAMTGFRTFVSTCAVGDTFRYTLQGVDSSGVPTGEWEVGIGTYSAANQITRSVLDSSNAGAVVNLSAGTKQIWIGMDAMMGRWIQERLTAARTYYVRTDGSDSNTGLVDSAGGAFLTIQKAVDTVAALDMGKFQVTVQVKGGTYNAGAVLPKCRGDFIPIIQGNVSTPSTVHVSVTGVSAFQTGPDTLTTSGIVWHVQGLKITSPGKHCLVSQGEGNVISFSNLDFGVAWTQLSASTKGKILVKGPYWISGSANLHMGAANGGEILGFTGSGTFLASVSIGIFAWAYSGSVINANGMSPYSMGSFTCTGKRYEGFSGSNLIPCSGGFPGTTGGSLSFSSYWA